MCGEGGCSVVGRCGCPADGPRVAAPGIPRVLAALARAPFVEDERGRTWWRAAPCPAAPGIPRSLRSRPLTLERRGRGIPAFAGMTGEVRYDGGG